MRVYVATCDKYDHLMPGFAYLFNKYWGAEQQVDVLGFRSPPIALPKNFKFHSMQPVETKAWTTNLGTFLRTQSDPYFTFLLDDYWLTQPVDMNRVAVMEDEVKTGAVKGDLSTNTAYFQHHLYRNGLVLATRSAQYRTSTQPCIWSRDFMLDLMVPGLNPWQFELQHNPAARRGDIVGPTEQIYEFANMYYKGAPASYMIDKIKAEDMSTLSAMGAFKHIPGYTER
jgi:hypothetical protein